MLTTCRSLLYVSNCITVERRIWIRSVPITAHIHLSRLKGVQIPGKAEREEREMKNRQCSSSKPGFTGLHYSDFHDIKAFKDRWKRALQSLLLKLHFIFMDKQRKRKNKLGHFSRQILIHFHIFCPLNPLISKGFLCARHCSRRWEYIRDYNRWKQETEKREASL